MKKNYFLKFDRGGKIPALFSALLFCTLLFGFGLSKLEAQNATAGWETIAGWTNFSNAITGGYSADCGTGSFTCNRALSSINNSNLGTQICGSTATKHIYTNNKDANTLTFSVSNVSQYKNFKFSFVNYVEDNAWSALDYSYIPNMKIEYYNGSDWTTLESAWGTSESNKTYTSSDLSNSIHEISSIQFKISYEQPLGTQKTKSYFDNIIITGEKDIKTITLNPTPAGVATFTEAGTYEYGDSCSAGYTITNTAYRFINWKEGNNSVSTANPYTFTVSENRTLTANFEPKKYKITFPSSPTTYNLAISSGVSGVTNDTITALTPVLFSVTPQTGYTQSTPVVKINGTTLSHTSVTNGTYFYSLSSFNSNVTVTIDALPLNVYKIAGSINPQGAASLRDTGNYVHGTFPTISFDGQNASYQFVNWKEGTTILSTNTSYTFSNLTEAHTVTANFELKQYTVTFIDNSSTTGTLGDITGINANNQANYGANIGFTFTPAVGYTQAVPDVKAGNTALTHTNLTNGVYTYAVNNITSDTSIYISAQPINRYNITFNPAASENYAGAYNVGPNLSDIEHGENYSFTFTLGGSYNNSTVKLECGGTELSEPYTIENVTKDTTIHVLCLYKNEYDTLFVHADTLASHTISYDNNGYTHTIAGTGTFKLTKNVGTCTRTLELTVISVANPKDTTLYCTNDGQNIPNIDIPHFVFTPEIPTSSFSITPSVSSYTIGATEQVHENAMSYIVRIGTREVTCYNKVKIYRMKCENQFKVTYGEYTYQTVFVGGKCWLKENLRYRGNLTAPSVRAYQNEESNVALYGLLYTWYAAAGLAEGSTDNPLLYSDEYNNDLVKGICPDGWYLPRESDLTALVNAAGDIRSTDPTYLLDGVQANNPNGFNMVPSGYYDGSTFIDLLIMGYIWSTSATATHATYYTCPFGCNPYDVMTIAKSSNMSVRCIKDNRSVGFDPID